MYAFTLELQQAWASILDGLQHTLPQYFFDPPKIIFDDEGKTFNDNDFFMGHTCGYPYVKHWHQSHNLLCVPEFDIQGCDKTQYSSWLIAHHSSDCKSIAELKDSTVVINNRNSNSGMNVFRYEVSKYANGDPFFQNVLISRSHVESLRMVSESKADITAIDAVSYYFAVEHNLVDRKKIKIIGQTKQTTGLPFIMKNSLDVDRNEIIDGLNSALDDCESDAKECLKLQRFKKVDTKDYESIIKLETIAREVGYPKLR